MNLYNKYGLFLVSTIYIPLVYYAFDLTNSFYGFEPIIVSIILYLVFFFNFVLFVIFVLIMIDFIALVSKKFTPLDEGD